MKAILLIIMLVLCTTTVLAIYDSIDDVEKMLHDPLTKNQGEVYVYHPEKTTGDVAIRLAYEGPERTTKLSSTEFKQFVKRNEHFYLYGWNGEIQENKQFTIEVGSRQIDFGIRFLGCNCEADQVCLDNSCYLSEGASCNGEPRCVPPLICDNNQCSLTSTTTVTNSPVLPTTPADTLLDSVNQPATTVNETSDTIVVSTESTDSTDTENSTSTTNTIADNVENVTITNEESIVASNEETNTAGEEESNSNNVLETNTTEHSVVTTTNTSIIEEEFDETITNVSNTTNNDSNFILNDATIENITIIYNDSIDETMDEGNLAKDANTEESSESSTTNSNEPINGITDNTPTKPIIRARLDKTKVIARAKELRKREKQNLLTEEEKRTRLNKDQEKKVKELLYEKEIRAPDIYVLQKELAEEQTIIEKELHPSKKKTDIVVKVRIVEPIEKMDIIEVIPKEIAQTAGELTFSVVPTIIEDDPIVMWHLENVTEDIELTYTVNKNVTITGNTVALIDEEVSKTNNVWFTWYMLAPILLIPLIASVITFFSKHKFK